MTTNIVNDGVASTGSNIPVYYYTGYSAPGVLDLTFQIYGPGGFAEYNPPGTAFVEYFDVATGRTVVEVFLIGGQNGPSEITLRTGSLAPGDALGQITITVIDNDNIPGAGPGAKFLGSVGKVLKALGYVGNAIDGVFGVPGYSISLLQANLASIDFNVSYPPGHLSSLGIDPNNLPSWLSPSYDALGNFIGLDAILCFAAGTEISISSTQAKAIEKIDVGDIVLSYDATGTLVPGCVTRTFRNEVSHLLDIHGLKVTPGHVTLCGDGMFKGRHVPIIDILLSDGALVTAEGALVRMSINKLVGSVEDRVVKVLHALTSDEARSGQLRDGEMRVGTLLFDREGAPISVLDCLTAEGLVFDLETGLVAKPGEAPHPLYWFGALPRPADYILTRSRETLEGILVDGGWEGSRSELIVGRLWQTNESWRIV